MENALSIELKVFTRDIVSFPNFIRKRYIQFRASQAISPIQLFLSLYSQSAARMNKEEVTLQSLQN